MHDTKKDYMVEFFTTTLVGPKTDNVRDDIFLRCIFRLEPKALAVLEDDLHSKYADLLLDRMPEESGAEEADQVGVTVTPLIEFLQIARKEGLELEGEARASSGLMD